MTTELTAERLRSLLTYDPDTGIFTNRNGRGHAQAGAVAGHVDCTTGYRRIVINRRAHKAHRLAWLHVHGQWPAAQLDHKNGDRSDNRIANLRECSKAENSRNVKPRSASGVVGVHPHGARWRSQIRVAGRNKHLGLFDSINAAAAARRAAELSHHGAFASHLRHQPNH